MNNLLAQSASWKCSPTAKQALVSRGLASRTGVPELNATTCALLSPCSQELAGLEGTCGLRLHWEVAFRPFSK